MVYGISEDHFKPFAEIIDGEGEVIFTVKLVENHLKIMSKTHRNYYEITKNLNKKAT